MTTYRSPQSLIAMIGRVHSVRGRRQAGVYSIEGTRLVERALRARAPLEAVLVSEALARGTDPRLRRLLDDLAVAGCPVMTAPDNTLAKLTEGRDLGHILGLVKLPPRIGLSDLPASHLSTGDTHQPVSPARLLLAAVDIADPGNVGALTRTAHAGGAAALLAVGDGDPYHPRATRISRGSIFKLPIIQYETAAEMIADLRDHAVTVVGTAAGENADGEILMDGPIPLQKFNWPGRDTAILMGNEAGGLPPDIQATLDHTVTIPMSGGVDSYSVNAAAAIILYVASQSLATQTAGGDGRA